MRSVRGLCELTEGSHAYAGAGRPCAPRPPPRTGEYGTKMTVMMRALASRGSSAETNVPSSWRGQYVRLCALALVGAMLLMFGVPARSALAAPFNVTKTADTNDGICN